MVKTTVNLSLNDKMIWEEIYTLHWNFIQEKKELHKLFKEISCLWEETGLLYVQS